MSSLVIPFVMYSVEKYDAAPIGISMNMLMPRILSAYRMPIIAKADIEILTSIESFVNS